MTQETDTLVHDDEWIDDEDGALTDDDAFDDDRPEDEPPSRSRRRKVPPLAIGLSAVVIAGLGFIGGVQVQKRSGGDATDGMPAGLAAMMQGGGPGGGGPDAARGGSGGGGTGSAGSSSTTGEVANVKGSKLYVTTADGSTVEVSVGKSATVQRVASAAADEIRPGDTVIVTGTTGGDGTVKASAVQATESGVTLLGGFGGRGGPSASGATGSGSASGSGGGSGSTAPGDDSAAVDQLFESGD